MPRRKTGIEPSDKLGLKLSPDFLKIIVLVGSHYARTDSKFGSRSVMWNGSPNKSAAVQIALADWLDALRQGESATTDALRAELEEYYAAAGMSGEAVALQVFFAPDETARYNALIDLLITTKGSFAYAQQHIVKSLIICVALARYVRLRVGRKIGLCHDLDP